MASKDLKFIAIRKLESHVWYILHLHDPQNLAFLDWWRGFSSVTTPEKDPSKKGTWERFWNIISQHSTN